MEWKNNLRRVQSLHSVAGQWDQKTSVSQLVARYQTTAEVKTSVQTTSVKEITTCLPENTESRLASLIKRDDEKREQSPIKAALSRSKSMVSLQTSSSAGVAAGSGSGSGSGSLGALKALFESKSKTPQTNQVKSFRAADVTSHQRTTDVVTTLTNGEVEEEEEKIPAPVAATNDETKRDAQQDHVTRKVMDRTRTERRRTVIGGIDFEKLAASQADEKRRSIADFRDSSFLQTKEKLSVSVKAMSALYQSKVATQEPTHNLLKPAQNLSSESGKRVKLTKMAEDSKQRREDLPLPPSTRLGLEDISGAQFQQSMPAQVSKEKLYQQRQKCELKRLMKHTHPELKMLDEAVDEELAEVLSSEAGVTAGETGYEGEVLSRRLIFENCALSTKVSPYSPKMHMAEGTADVGVVSKTSAASEQHEERPCNESVKEIVEDEEMIDFSPDPSRELEEEMIRIDVQATRRIFESQPDPDNKFQGKVSISGEETGPAQKRKHELEICSKESVCNENKSSARIKSPDLTDQPHKQERCDDVVAQSSDLNFSFGESDFDDEPTGVLGPEGFEDNIKTSAALFKNNPFISTNIERENVHTSKTQIPVNPSGAAEDSLITNVKNRTHLFESMPFDKIRHQNKDEIETLVENIEETLDTLYHANIIHSDGSIIEVNETMIAKKARFRLSEEGPEIKYDEVAEGGAQNFIVQLLPRANLKHQIIYLKEDSKGSMDATVVNIPAHQHHTINSQDTEFKTANVVQLVEDILNQDNSLRKGVIIQEDANKCAEVIVYSLYNYVDKEDVKSYSAPQAKATGYYEPETEKINLSKTEKTLLQDTSQDHTCTGSVRPEVTVRGNVKLFKSCIEKGDLEYLKTLKTESDVEEQELPSNQAVADWSESWVPVDVKRLKGMFSVDQAKQNTQSTTIPRTFTGQNVSTGMSPPPPKELGDDQVEEWVPVDVRRMKNLFSGDQKQNQAKQITHESCARSNNITQSFMGKTGPTGASQPSRDSQEQTLPLNQTTTELIDNQEEEWVPVDVKRLKDMFSRDQGQSQASQNTHENRIQSTTIPHAGMSQTRPTGTSQPPRGSQEQELPPNQTVVENRDDQTEDSLSEWVSVDVKRLKDMFSSDQNQNQAHCAPSHVFVGQTASPVSNHPTRGFQNQELPQNQTWDGQSREPYYELRDDQAEEGSSEWEPVDVKKLKDMFSRDQEQSQANQNTHGNRIQPTTIPHADMGQTGPAGMSQRPGSSQEQELPPNQTVVENRGDQTEESSSEWVSVDVKRLKDIFSSDQKQNQAHCAPTHVSVGKTVPPGTSHLSRDSQDQELPSNQTSDGQTRQPHYKLRDDQAEEGSSEWVPVDVKRMKDMFSRDQGQSPVNQNIHENRIQPTTIPHAFNRQIGPTGTSQPMRGSQEQELPSNQTVVLHRDDQTEESSSEWVSVDVKRLKDMFSGDQNQNQAHCAPSHVFVGQTVPPVSNHPTKGSQDQQLPSNQTWDGQSREPHYEVSDDQAEEGSSEWEPVDVKRMKDLFSVDQRQNQAKQSTQENRAQSTTISHAIMGQPGPAGMSQSPRSCQDLTQDLLLNQTVAELRGDQGEEWAPVDVKRLKGMFSGDQNQAKQSTQENRAQSTTIAHTFKTHTLPPCTSQLPKSAQEQESPPNQTMTELRSDQEEEWVHVDVKRLKDMFSGDQGQNQTKQCIQDNVHHTTFPHASTGQTGPTVMSQSPREFQGQELPPNETLVELSGDQAEEWVPVDVKRLKDLFSGDQGQNQAKLITHENRPQSQECVDQTVPPGTSHLFSGSQERDFLSNQTVVGQGTKIHNELRGDEAEEISSEWVPVNVERLKGLFSGDQGQNQVKQGTFENHAQSSTVSHAFTGQPPKEHSLDHRKSKNTLGECSRQAQEQVCNLTVASQGSYLHLGRLDDDRIHQAELVEVVDDSDEISNLQTAIQCLQQATTEAKALYHSSQNKQKCLIGDVRDSELNQESENQKLDSLELLACQHQNTETHHEVQTAETCNKKGQIGTGVVQKHFEALSDSPDTTPGQQEQEEVVFHGKLQAALDSLERSNINVARGDFKAAMIYRNASKPHKETSQNVEVASVQYNAVEEFCSTAESKSTQAPLKQEVAKMPVDSKPAIPPKPERMNVKQARDRSNNTENPEENQTNMIGPEMKNQSKEETVVHKVHSGAESVGDKGETIQMSQKIQVRQQVQGSINNISTQPEEINTTEVKPPQENISMKENSNETDEHHVDFREACQKFGGKKTFSAKNPPVKPKRVKIAQSENKNPKDTSGDNNPLKPQQAITGPSYSDQNTSGQAADNKDKQERDMKQESKVEMREKKSRTETENERRQRLSVHMDEIMRGNITAAMEIFDNLRKQEELESILSRVEEIEQDTSEVDVRSLRRVFEDVPEWVVSSDKKKQKIIKAEHREEKSVLKDDPESKSSMAHVFGDLERASEEIINLKEQTLARLMDIEEAIKKALYSVSTLKSESDIAGLSCLFKESLGTVQGSTSSGNISKISIGSSKSKTPQVHEIPTTKGNVESNEGASAKLRTSPPSSPAFISIQSAARKNDTLDMGPPEAATCPTCQQKPKTEREEKFRTTKTLTCNSPAQNRKRDPRKGGQKQSTSSPLNPKRELTVLEVQTDHEGSHVIGTKTVTEKYEQTDKFGNRIYSSKTSTVLTTQPETTTTSTGPTISSPTTNQVSTHPEVLLPISQKP